MNGSYARAERRPASRAAATTSSTSFIEYPRSVASTPTSRRAHFVGSPMVRPDGSFRPSASAFAASAPSVSTVIAAASCTAGSAAADVLGRPPGVAGSACGFSAISIPSPSPFPANGGAARTGPDSSVS